jgi:hypothetical protein
VRKDINIPKVEDIGVAIVKEQNELGKDEWKVYVINYQKKPINNVLISSKGYGSFEGDTRKTSFFTFFIEELAPESFKFIELIIEEVFPLTNEYLVSYYQNGLLYDKKFIFLPESIVEENLITIPLVNKPGVLIR